VIHFLLVISVVSTEVLYCHGFVSISPGTTRAARHIATGATLCQAPPRLTFTYGKGRRNRKASAMGILESTKLDCICIHCKYVTRCEAYHFVEEKHEQPHMTKTPTFTPRNGSPTIHVNIRTSRQGSEAGDDVTARIWSEHEAQQQIAEERAAQKGTDVEQEVMTAAGGAGGDYDLSVQTTYEYDVVACEDFAEERNAWVKNMPDEIRKVNPDFVPT
jgi:hypothetical protein